MESTLIYHMGRVKAHFAHGKKRIFHSTGVKVLKQNLNNKGLIKPNAVKNWSNLNEQILIKKNQLDDAILEDLRSSKSIDVDRIKLLLKDAGDGPIDSTTNIVDKKKSLLSEMMTDFISNQSKMNRGLKWRYESLEKIIKKDDRQCIRVKVPYLHEKLDEFRGTVNANTAYTRYKNFKKFILWGTENGYPLPNVDWKKLSRPTFKPDFIFISETRIKELIDYSTETEFEEKVKRIFLVLIYTGMRYSDYKSLNKSEIHNNYIDKVAAKTKVRFKVPIHNAIRFILKDPPKMEGQVFNKGIQALGKKLGWTEHIRFQTDINKFVMVQYYEKLCSSVGRHTFATRALLANTPHNVVMGWCGWTNSAMLFYYSEKLKMQTSDWMTKID